MTEFALHAVEILLGILAGFFWMASFYKLLGLFRQRKKISAKVPSVKTFDSSANANISVLIVRGALSKKILDMSQRGSAVSTAPSQGMTFTIPISQKQNTADAIVKVESAHA